MNLVLAAGLIAIFVALALFLIGIGVFAADRRGSVARSLAAVEALQAAPKALREQELERPFGDRVVDPLIQRLQNLARRFTPDQRVQRLRTRLDLAGNPAGWDTDRVLGLKALGLLTGVLVGGVLPLVFGASAGKALVAAVGVGLLGWFGPSLWLYQSGYDRSERMRRELPDAMDLLTISVEAGLAFDAAVAQVARKTEGPLAAEFFRVLQEMQIGTGRVEAMRALGERTNVPELRSFVGAMIQADSFGIPISSVLRVQSRELRVKRTQRAEEQAQKVPIKILFPLIFCILPTLFLVIMGPAVIQILTSLKNL